MSSATALSLLSDTLKTKIQTHGHLSFTTSDMADYRELLMKSNITDKKTREFLLAKSGYVFHMSELVNFKNSTPEKKLFDGFPKDVLDLMSDYCKTLILDGSRDGKWGFDTYHVALCTEVSKHKDNHLYDHIMVVLNAIELFYAGVNGFVFRKVYKH